MNSREIMAYVNSHPEEILQPDGSGKGYICPKCGSGSGQKGTGLTCEPKKSGAGYHLHCYACGFDGDAFDAIGEIIETTDYTQRARYAADQCGLQLEDRDEDARALYASFRKEQEAATAAGTRAPEAAEPKADFTELFREAHQHINETDYHRGLSAETLERFNVGYLPSWKHPKAPAAVPTSPRLIIPTSATSYIARDTRPGVKDYAKQKFGEVHFLNVGALDAADQPIYIVEGEIDALSIIDVGGEAIALGSTSMIKKFAQIVKDHRPKKPLLLALDHDGAGAKAAGDLGNMLGEMNVPFYTVDVSGSYKDANEALIADRDAFAAAVYRANSGGALSAAADVQSFVEYIGASMSAPCYSTGFPSVDELLDGGLYPGLYVIGAISSLGKTTFCVNVMDAIAAAGHDVYFFSLEMSKYEIMAKSVSRLTLEAALEAGSDTRNAKTTRGILAGAKYARYSAAEKALIKNAIDRYGATIAPHVFLKEGSGNVGISHIRQSVEELHSLSGRYPVIIIDYAQIISPADPRATDKQNTDKAILELKRMSRDFETPVIAISSFNRDNYTEPVNMASFKESGAIEYSSDVLIGLQYAGMDYQEGEKADDRKKRVRGIVNKAIAEAKSGQAVSVEVKVLKNRNGSKGETRLDFYPMFNKFADEEKKKSLADEFESAWEETQPKGRKS